MIPAEQIEQFLTPQELPEFLYHHLFNDIVVKGSNEQLGTTPSTNFSQPGHDHLGDTIKPGKIDNYNSPSFYIRNMYGSGFISIQSGTCQFLLRESDQKALLLLNGGQSCIFLKDSIHVGASHNPYLYKLSLPNNYDNGRAIAYAWDLYASSITRKTDVEEIQDPLEKLDFVRGLTYIDRDTPDTGFVVEDIDKTGLPGIVNREDPKNPSEITSYSGKGLLSLLFAAVREIKHIVFDLRERVEVLERGV